MSWEVELGLHCAVAGIADMSSFDESLRVFATTDAASLASNLFRESFNSEFPEPRTARVLDVDIHPADWRQYVAMYRWPDGREECVGFCNWIRYKEVYLEGGLAARRDFYRRLDREHFASCRARGGVAQIVMEHAATELNDCAAWFGYCGDAKALQVDLRVGYVRTEHPFVIVKWMREMSVIDQRQLIDEIIRIGPF